MVKSFFGIRFIILIILVIYSTNSLPGELRKCELYKKQVELLSQEKKEILRSSGFATLSYNQPFPVIVISKEVISDCENRVTAEKFFQNQIDNREKFSFSEKKFARAKVDIVKAARIALNSSKPWDGGMVHEIKNIVSDKLRPEWEQVVSEEIEEGGVKLDFFTESLFRNPPSVVIESCNRIINKPGTMVNAALLMFLQKNGGKKFEKNEIIKNLRKGSPPSWFNEDQVEKIIINEAIKLLRKKDVINLGEAREYFAKVYGWV